MNYLDKLCVRVCVYARTSKLQIIFFLMADSEYVFYMININSWIFRNKVNIHHNVKNKS